MISPFYNSYCILFIASYTSLLDVAVVFVRILGIFKQESCLLLKERADKSLTCVWIAEETAVSKSLNPCC